MKSIKVGHGGQLREGGASRGLTSDFLCPAATSKGGDRHFRGRAFSRSNARRCVCTCKGAGPRKLRGAAARVISRTQVVEGCESSRGTGGSTSARRILAARRCRPEHTTRGRRDFGQWIRRFTHPLPAGEARWHWWVNLEERCMAQPTSPSSRCFEAAPPPPLHLLDYRVSPP